MQPGRWQRVKEALGEALALGGPARTAYLERLGATDPALRTELESLLQAEQSAGTGFLEHPAAAILETPAPQSPHVGRRLGPYRLLEEIGAGGMGEVYRAVRVDEEYEHEVAVKLVRAGVDAQFLGPRLRTERQILAAFQHPNIARLFDGGTTEDGIPYLVMELIAGQPITEYCDRHRLDVEARLRLFLLVCSAVQYAHQHAVIHRDLKPSNILVTADGTPKLLDFGIAKILEPGAIPAHGDLTVNAMRLLTPDYASPEQLKGEPVSAASDVYSLGVILYELLTGIKPQGGRGRPTEKAPRADIGRAPTRPSIVVRGRDLAGVFRQDSPERLSHRLRGDIDNIVLMALRQEPERRYATVDRMAEDIRRHLGHLPVAARRPTLSYRTSMFVRRHRVGVAATALTALALIVGVVMTARATLIARAALARAQDEASASQRVSDYLVSLFEEANPEKNGGQALDVRTLVARAQAEIDPQLSGQPALRARMLSAVGALHCEIGQFEPCERDLEEALQIEKTIGAAAADPLLRAKTEYRLARAYNDAGRTREALVLLNRALPVFESQQPTDPLAIAGVWNAIGRAYLETDPLRAIAALRRARALERGAHGEDTVASAGTLGNLAVADAQAMRWSEALALAQARVELVEAHFKSSDVRYFDALNDYAEVAQEAGRFDDATRVWRQVLVGYAHILGRSNDKYIDTELSLGDVLFRRNRLRESIFWFRLSVDGYRAQESLHREKYIGALFALSQVLLMYGDYRGAASAAREGYRAYEQTGGPPESTAAFRIRLAHPLAFVGETRRALELLSAPMRGDPHSALTSSFEGLRLLWLADTYREAGADAQAAVSYDQAIAYLASHRLPHSAALAMAYEGKALLLAREHRFAAAVPLYRLAISGYADSRYAPDGPTMAATRIELADSLASLGRVAEARALVVGSGAIVDAGLARTHPARIALARLRKTLHLPHPTPMKAGGGLTRPLLPGEPRGDSRAH